MRRITTIGVGAITFLACLIFVTTLARATLYYENANETDVQYTTSSATHPRNTVVPSRLIIPAIKVDAAIQNVGLGKSGNMAVPSNYTDVGWYRYGPTPGQVGSAVIDGHVDNGFGLEAVFKNVSALEPGDDIYVATKIMRVCIL
jgi:sortase (surface protein transpeptidase)